MSALLRVSLVRVARGAESR